MTISQADSGLLPDKYAIIRNGGRPSAYSVVAHQYNPVFTEVTSPSSAISNNTSNFAVIKGGRYIFRFSNGLLERFDTQTLTWTLLTNFSMASISATLEPSPPALTYASDNSVSVFQCTLYGVYQNRSTDSGDTWSGWALIDIPVFGAFTQNYHSFGPDQARDAIAVTASSTASGYNPLNVIDDDATNTAWRANAVATSASPQWIRLQFAAPVLVWKIVLRLADGCIGPEEVHIEYSSDGVGWTTGFTSNAGSGGWVGNETEVIAQLPRLAAIGNAEYWRIKFYSGSANTTTTGFRDIQLCAATVQDRGVIQAITAPAWDRIHMLCWNATKDIYNLSTILWNSGTSDWDYAGAGNIYWPWKPTSFHATSTSVDTDTLAISSEVPGTPTVINEGNTAAKYMIENGGVCVFNYSTGVWSDHKPVDIVEGVEDWRYRTNARITRINGRLYVTCASSDGTRDYPIAGYRCYRAGLAGEYWSLNNLMGLPDMVGSSGLVFIAEGEKVFAFESKKVYSAPSTLFFGYSATEMQHDLTDEISDYEFSQEAIFQAGIKLDNSTGQYDNHSIFNINNTIQLIHKAGYWAEIESQWQKVMVQIGKTQVESIEHENTLDSRTVRVTMRDLMSRMTDYVQSEQAHYWKSQGLGHDLFKDSGQSSYGGLAHTATTTGSHKTDNGYLVATSTQAVETIAYSTFDSDLWNGAVQVGMLIPANTGIFASWSGVVFRTGWEAVYAVNPGGGAGYLEVRGPGANSTVGSALAWNGTPDTGRYIRVQFHYGTIAVLTSGDSAPGVRDGGKTWQVAFEHIIDQESYKRFAGMPTRLRRLRNVMQHSGYVGTVMRGMDG